MTAKYEQRNLLSGSEIPASEAFAPPVPPVNGSEAIQARPRSAWRAPRTRPTSVRALPIPPVCLCAPCIIEHAANYCHACDDVCNF